MELNISINNMDKIIEKKTGWRVAFTKKALPYWLGALLAVFIVYLIARPNNKTLRVDKDTVTISTAVQGEFNDYIRISGRVQPMTTIQLSPQEGGIVEKILIEEGSPVKAGDAILVLTNDNLDMQILNAEADLAEKENIQRNTQISMEQQKLDVRQNVLEYGMQVERLKRAYEQQKALYEDKLRKTTAWPGRNTTWSANVPSRTACTAASRSTGWKRAWKACCSTCR